MLEMPRTTVLDIVRYLREKIRIATSRQSTQELQDLAMMIDMLIKAVYATKDQQLASLLEDFATHIRDAQQGLAWKSTLPSEEDIANCYRKK